MESAAAFADAEGAAPRMTTMSEGEEERFAALFGIAQECVTADDLRPLLRGEPYPVCYDGFEPSGRMHIAQGIVKVINVNKMVRVGWHVKIWIADWFALLNKKLEGDLNKIQAAGRRMIEVLVDHADFLKEPQMLC